MNAGRVFDRPAPCLMFAAHKETAIHNSAPPDRESVWSVPGRWQTAYFALFAIQNIAGISLVCWYEITVVNGDDFVQTMLNIIDRLPSVGVGAAAVTITLMEVARTAMVIGGNLERWLKKREQERLDRAVAEATARAKSEARNEVQRRWAEWNQRRLDAEARGEPFTEPPPDFSSNTNGEV